MLSGLSDYLDGKIARRFGLESRVGQLLDPLADRLYIATTLVGLAWRDIIPWWLVAVLVGREVLLAGVLAWIRRYGQTGLPVHFVGKAATFNLLYAFPLLLLGQGDGGFAALGAADRLGLRLVGDRPLLDRRGHLHRPGPSGGAGSRRRREDLAQSWAPARTAPPRRPRPRGVASTSP